MPQLNTTPWLMILIFTWFVFLIFILPKVMTYIFPNEPTLKNKKTFMPWTWNWPWY
ncbi:ATP synthase F0 subunit 8 (mitochondrion) [Betta splendens]|uniref:ATP synthase complex subunit 8 n=2 Tax=Betta TaxID=158455 RepID=A0A0C6EL36_BETSP|nr:ATP synthase F0 subunit 8 [Betta splendens]YP_009947885.1 ATP synthase F0 subunit 8 [Betta mahachaiensis]AKJ84076.1 ATP synthase F0 subunit 8 [Betta splendens]QOH97053.1 ATP synthase F0 subunit 8 [Betta mahachaiensis]BAQ35532.1 ATPase subunit 8 [Betta splendens]